MERPHCIGNVCSAFGRKGQGRREEEKWRRKGRIVGNSGEARKQGEETHTQTQEPDERQAGPREGERWVKAGDTGSSLDLDSLPQDRAGLSGSSQPPLLGLAWSLWRAEEERQRAKAPEQMRV